VASHAKVTETQWQINRFQWVIGKLVLADTGEVDRAPGCSNPEFSGQASPVSSKIQVQCRELFSSGSAVQPSQPISHHEQKMIGS
jgi:hypothetical protein